MKKTKLQRDKEKALVTIQTLKTAKDFEGDVLKHFIRETYWSKRVYKLLRSREIDQIKYFSLCAKTAFDTRLFVEKGYIDYYKSQKPFVFCEIDKKSFNTLRRAFPNQESEGFEGSLEEISTDPQNQHFGRFWSTFPFDAINLDFWGDIHKIRKPQQNTFRAIQSIIQQQAHLREPYELWITWRAKEGRVAPNIRQAFVELIDSNLEKEEFNRIFQEQFENKSKASALEVEDLVRVGFLKWLLYITKLAYSTIESCDILVYSRQDKDEESYHLYNFLLRINPYPELTIPTPACSAATFCETEYEKGLKICFQKPIDVDLAFNSLSKTKREEIEASLEKLTKDFIKSGGLLK